MSKMFFIPSKIQHIRIVVCYHVSMNVSYANTYLKVHNLIIYEALVHCVLPTIKELFDLPTATYKPLGLNESHY